MSHDDDVIEADKWAPSLIAFYMFLILAAVIFTLGPIVLFFYFLPSGLLLLALAALGFFIWPLLRTRGFSQVVGFSILLAAITFGLWAGGFWAPLGLPSLFHG